MKAATLLLYFLLCSAIVKGQYTAASISGFAYGSTVTYADPVTGSVDTRFVGLLNGRLTDSSTGPIVSYYFLDALIPAGFSIPRNDYHDDITSDGIEPHACWIINNFYPGKNGTGQLSDLNKETAAIQFAIWHYTFGLQINSISDSVIRNRASEIKTLAISNGSSVRQSVEFVMDEDPEFFSIKTVDDNGNPIAIDTIELSFTEGILSTYLISTTLPLGISERVQVIGANTGIIDAFSRKFVFPKGSIFRHNSNSNPRIFLAKPGFGARSFIYDWGTLPVELISFTSIVNSQIVELKWSTSAEINNSHFEIERRNTLENWRTIGRVNGNGTVNSVSIYGYTDRNIASGIYMYRLKQVDYNGNYEYFNLSGEVSIGLPEKFELGQNYPNPFNPSTKINYKLQASGFITLRVFDIAGKQVAELVNSRQDAGTYEVNFDASHFGISAGVYFYKLNAGDFSLTKKMVVLE
jgi:hypothetical protein